MRTSVAGIGQSYRVGYKLVRLLRLQHLCGFDALLGSFKGRTHNHCLRRLWNRALCQLYMAKGLCLRTQEVIGREGGEPNKRAQYIVEARSFDCSIVQGISLNSCHWNQRTILVKPRSCRQFVHLPTQPMIHQRNRLKLPHKGQCRAGNQLSCIVQQILIYDYDIFVSL